MPVIPEQLPRSGGLPTASELERQLLAGETLLAESANHRMQVVDVLESYGLVLDAYSRNLIYQAETQFLNPFPIFKFLDGDHRPAKIWQHLIHDRRTALRTRWARYKDECEVRGTPVPDPAPEDGGSHRGGTRPR